MLLKIIEVTINIPKGLESLGVNGITIFKRNTTIPRYKPFDPNDEYRYFHKEEFTRMGGVNRVSFQLKDENHIGMKEYAWAFVSKTGKLRTIKPHNFSGKKVKVVISKNILGLTTPKDPNLYDLKQVIIPSSLKKKILTGPKYRKALKIGLAKAMKVNDEDLFYDTLAPKKKEKKTAVTPKSSIWAHKFLRN